MKSYKIILFTPLRRRLLEVLEERRPLLVLLDAGKHHLRALDEFLGFVSHLSIVSSSHVTPLPDTAPLKPKPGAVPAARPKTPWRFGPCLCAPPASIVWHWLHLRLCSEFMHAWSRRHRRAYWSLDRCAALLSQRAQKVSGCGAAAALGLEDLRALVALAHWSLLLFVP